MRRGVTCSIYRKEHLVRLCEIAVELDLEVVQTEDDYKDMDLSRRTVDNDIILPDVTTINDWTEDLKTLPYIESYDILIYLMQICEWSENRLSNYRSANGY